MKKIIIFILVFSMTFINIASNFNKVYSQGLIVKYNNVNPLSVEKNYLEQLQSISDQLDILSSNILNKITNNQDKKTLSKDASFIKSQIRSLRLELSEYHNTESGDIDKNPLSLSFLNILNFYSMSLSYLLGVLESTNASDESKYLQSYYTNKSFGDFMLLWATKQVNSL